jgi:hypothetical protein
MRYIELNPVRADMVISPEQYQWSSFIGVVGGEKDAVVMSHSLYHKLGRTKDIRHMLTTLIRVKYAMPDKLARHWGMIIFAKKLKVS